MGEIHISARTNYENPASALVSHRRKKGVCVGGVLSMHFLLLFLLQKVQFQGGGGRFGSSSGLCRYSPVLK